MAVAFGALGAKGSGTATTPVVIAYPASVGAGDMILACRCGWLSGMIMDDVSGWINTTELGGGTGTAADNHTTKIRVDRREAAGGETGNVNFAISGTISGAFGYMARYTKGAGTWDVATAVGTGNTHGANRSVTAASSISLDPGDVVVAFAAVDTDPALTITAPAITATGITFGATTKRTAGVVGSTTGVDGNIEIFEATVTAGSGTQAPVLNFTTATSQCGPVAFVRLREVASGTDFTQTPTDNEGLTDAVVFIRDEGNSDDLGLTDPIAITRGEMTADNLGLTDSVSVVGAFRYVAGVSANGRYFVDQDGNPILVRGESPWSMFTDLSSSQVDTYLQNRAGYGCNLMLVSMIGAVANGAPADTGATYDGILPFTGGDPTVFNSAYWSRMDTYIAKARDLGITLMIYPMDGWNTAFGSVVFNPGSISNAQCQTYGQTLATRYLSYRNIVWSFGGDYNEDSTVNDRFNACLTGIRAAGDTRPASIQLLYETSESHNSGFWEPKVQWNWVYSYYVTYKGTSDAYNHTWSASPTTRPALFSEGAYENSGSPHFGTDEALRRQACWALTSGSPGELTGQEGVWQFSSGWETILDTTAADQVMAIRDTFEALDWWTLVPDDANQLVTAGRGTRITTDSATFPVDNNYVTAAKSAAGTLAVIYLPNAASAITVDMGEMGANPTATWVDPTTGTTFSETPDGSYSRGTNAAADTDWLLILTGDAPSGTDFTQAPSDNLGLTDSATPVVASVPEVVMTVSIEIG